MCINMSTTNFATYNYKLLFHNTKSQNLVLVFSIFPPAQINLHQAQAENLGPLVSILLVKMRASPCGVQGHAQGAWWGSGAKPLVGVHGSCRILLLLQCKITDHGSRALGPGPTGPLVNPVLPLQIYT